MSTWTEAVSTLILCGVFSTNLLCQQSTTNAATVKPMEFPVTLRQNVTAGKTLTGTKIQATLEVATLLSGTVIPRNAVFSGEVVESVAKTATTPSRLALQFDSVRWKAGSAPVKLNLTTWYYPATNAEGQNLQYGPTQPANRTWNGEGQYPDPNSKVYKPFPGSDSGKDSSVPDTPSSITSNHRQPMKDIELARTSDGALDIVSNRANIKLDKLTVYVLASDDLPPAK